jgi:hypothetical protein
VRISCSFKESRRQGHCQEPSCVSQSKWIEMSTSRSGVDMILANEMRISPGIQQHVFKTEYIQLI